MTGNTVIDALIWMLAKIEEDEVRAKELAERLDVQLKFDWKTTRFALVTGHRRENFGTGFTNICKAIAKLAESHQDLHFVYPVHLNPRVSGPVSELLGGMPNVHLISPLDYELFVYLLARSYLVLTDSGGLQEEAPSLGKPVFLMRDTTERPEAVDAGTVLLVGSDSDRIYQAVNSILNDDARYKTMSRAHNPYGDGKAASRIVDVLLKI